MSDCMMHVHVIVQCLDTHVQRFRGSSPAFVNREGTSTQRDQSPQTMQGKNGVIYGNREEFTLFCACWCVVNEER